ncbi:MAG: 5'-nucleotidase C-terminal domain-containing protein [Flavobacteriaceae bacterium]|jgi:2',3'-cyclic-nucleotide 2'-phosphodiesterase (5'-nucleotidase family)|nr:5'-nucleotidase C-terminal domain-containing protein [Flavobacteriaceae bacterium]
MKTVRRLSIISCFIALLSCKTINLTESHKAYPNQIIDSGLIAEPAYVKEITPYKKQLDSIMKQPLSYAKEDFTKEGFSSNEGNLLADLVLDFSKKYAKEKNIPAPEFCLLNIGGVRTIIPKGTVTVGNMFEVSPFENALVFVSLDGSQIEELVDYLNKEKKGHPLAGIKITYKKDQPHSIEIEGVPFDPNKKYQVVTIDYLMNGGDKMIFFAKSKDAVVTGLRLRDVLIEQMKQYKVLPDSKDERLIFEN